MQQLDEDIELKRLRRHGGYSAAASWLASDPDDEALVFRKFNRLAALNLLYMQSEVLELEKRVDSMHLSTVDGHDMGLKDAARTWETLIRQCQPGSEFRLDAKERMDLLLELRKKLKDYHEALALQKDIASLRKPEDRVIEAVKHFFENPQHILGGSAKELFQETKTDGFNDLVALKPRAESDLFSDFLRRHWRDEEEVARDGVSHFKRFNEDSITRAVNVATVIVAAFFLIGTMVGFYFMKSTVLKLVMIAVFTTLFAGSLALVTNARRAEIFASTAAYAAVLVVFVSNSELSAS
ncbi:hypothetical protein BKA56DRAFT_256686 [Ilyonectria sp. MPI-CAGE-AT-0026]|nr:hypothetical protein BKA56DRAFT_256686 [Ilyonectria sp. MPI-CAGE-AT-0026]